LARACSGCHAERKNGEGLIPPLNGKPQAELIQTMRDFKTGRRVSSIMNRIAKGYEEADFVAMAEYFAGR
jgi:sulfide dehydrogenase cytochrome subunit